MASATEKAKELVDKFLKHVRNDNPPLPNAKGRAKECALICVDEILKDKMVLDGDYKFDEFKSAKFWEAVREETKKL